MTRLVTPEGFDFPMRRSMFRRYTAPMDTQYTTANSVVDQSGGGNLGPPWIACDAGGGAPGPSELACSTEYFNKDPFVWKLNPILADLMFRLPMYQSTIMAPRCVTANITAGMIAGFGFGTPGVPLVGGAQRLNASGWSLYYSLADSHWFVEVNNRFALAGHKQKVVDLGLNPGGIPNLLGAACVFMEILYEPRVALNFYLNGIQVYRFTDAQDGGGDTPIQGLWDNGLAVGSTITGMCLFSQTGNPGVGSRVQAGFMLPTCETFYDYNP